MNKKELQKLSEVSVKEAAEAIKAKIEWFVAHIDQDSKDMKDMLEEIKKLPKSHFKTDYMGYIEALTKAIEVLERVNDVEGIRKRLALRFDKSTQDMAIDLSNYLKGE